MPLDSCSPRLASLRQQMRHHGLDWLIVPRFDAHQGEYCAPHDERLAWLTGFTGSAGMAVIGLSQAALFIDGRYTVQARQQTDAAAFVFEHLHDAPPDHWITRTVQAGETIGFDPMLLPPAWHRRFAEAAGRVGADLVATPCNLVDAVWPDQPARPLGAITPMPLDLAGEAAADKAARIAAGLRQDGAALLVETQPDNIAWLLNVRGSDVAYNPVPHSFLLLEDGGQVTWFVDAAKLPNDVGAFELGHVTLAAPDAFLPTLKALCQPGRTVVIDPDFTPAAALLTAEAAGASVRLTRGPVTLAKAVKTDVELAGFRRAHREDGAAWCSFIRWLEHDVPRRSDSLPVTELEAEARILEYRQARSGYRDNSFRTISAADANAAMCHYAATPESNRAIRIDSVYLHDSGAQYSDATTDATRTFAFAAVPAAIRLAYTLVLKGFIALSSLRFPHGAQGHHLDAIARRPLWDYGMDYDHGTGHGVGHCLSVHEQPQRFGRAHNPVTLEPGMVMTIEPGFYQAGAFGIRIENEVEIVRDADGFLSFRALTLIPIQRRMIERSLLTLTEIAWLNAYHARVRQEVSPLLDPATALWLIDATAPL